MRILLVKPAFSRLLSNDVFLTYPLGPMLVAANLKQRGHDVRVFHDDVSAGVPIPRAPVQFGPMIFRPVDDAVLAPLQKVLDDFQPEVVGISSVTADSESALAVAQLVKSHGIRTIGGGIHPSLLPDEAAESYDAVFVGEGDSPEAIELFENPDMTFAQGMCPDLNLLLPDRKCVIGWERYTTFLQGMIQTQRGCPYSCGYCAAPKVFGNKVRMRDAGLVREEVESLGVQEGRIIDDAFAVNRNHGLAVCRELSKVNYSWVCDIALQNVDRELLNAMQDAGCTQINIGIESASERWQALSGKKIKPGQPEAVLGWSKQRDIKVIYYFMIGFPGETLVELQATLQMAKRLKDMGGQPCISIVTPSPGTRLAELVAETGHVADFTGRFIHQSSDGGFADVTEAEWQQILQGADQIG